MDLDLNSAMNLQPVQGVSAGYGHQWPWKELSGTDSGWKDSFKLY